MKKIEINILLLNIIEAFFLLFFFKESLVNIILGIFFGIIFINITKRIKKNTITNAILVIVSIILYIVLLYKITIFINYNILKNYSIILITISLILLSIYLVKNGYHTIIKTSEIIFYVIIFIKFISLILTIPLINYHNLVINFNWNYHFLYIALFLLYINKSIFFLENNYVENKIILLSTINPLYIKLLTLLIVGEKLSSLYRFPYINYLKRIKYFDFIERVDGILSFEYILCFIILLSFTLLIIKKQIAILFDNFITRKSQ